MNPRKLVMIQPIHRQIRFEQACRDAPVLTYKWIIPCTLEWCFKSKLVDIFSSRCYDFLQRKTVNLINHDYKNYNRQKSLYWIWNLRYLNLVYSYNNNNNNDNYSRIVVKWKFMDSIDTLEMVKLIHTAIILIAKHIKFV